MQKILPSGDNADATMTIDPLPGAMEITPTYPRTHALTVMPIHVIFTVISMFVRLALNTLVYTLTRSIKFTHLIARKLACSLCHSLTHSLTHSFAHSLTLRRLQRTYPGNAPLGWLCCSVAR